METEIYYLVQTMYLWSTIEVNGVPMKMPDQRCVGYLPLFKTMSDAQTWAAEGPCPDAIIMEVTGPKFEAL